MTDTVAKCLSIADSLTHTNAGFPVCFIHLPIKLRIPFCIKSEVANNSVFEYDLKN